MQSYAKPAAQTLTIHSGCSFD